GALMAAGLGLAARAGRPALAVATGLAATVWAYDLRLKHTPAGPAAMAAARGLDLLLGATATGAAGRTTGPGAGPEPAARGSVLGALPAAGLLGAHTYAVTAVSRHEAHGGSTTAPLAALAAVTALGAAALHTRRERGGAPGTARGTTAQTRRERRGAPDAAPRMRSGRGGDRSRPRPAHRPPAPLAATAPGLLRTALTGSYVRTAAVPLLHAALNPSPPLTQRAVGGGIRAMIPLQAALAARTGAVGTALAVMGLVPIARNLARKVSPT
ncbi:prenyltransferase, partial [Streptomyces atratus]|nr:prenyltransferase [Streptomyces atratus]